MPTPSLTDVRYDLSPLSDDDLHWFNEGTHARLFDRLGAHVHVVGGEPGVHFAVWAPNAERVSVVGDFNQWDKDRHRLRARGSSGIWEGFLPGVDRGAVYKYHVISRHHGYRVNKADPFAFAAETPPRTASVVARLDYAWQDATWMAGRHARHTLDAPMSIYEVHLGSWRRVPDDGNRRLSYRELGDQLADYASEMGFTHVELLPVMEHPFYGSWGYQTTGYFAPTSRYGPPEDFMYLIDVLHQHGVGVILDWVPSHFPGDEHGLAYFDGTHLFEHADARKGFHPDWKSYIFNYDRHEVRSFLLSSAMFWLERYHIDGLRVDAVASMLYLDYSRNAGEWIPNVHGGHENLEAIDFLRQLNTTVFGAHGDVQTMAEDSTSWPMVSRPTYVGGLGFGLKWDMGWMHDTLEYMALDPIYRKHHHEKLTFRMIYAFTENFVLPLSHDEVVYGKGSLLRRMAGGETDRFANLRLLLALMYAQSGKKLVFMGGEFGQWREWNHEAGLDWHLLEAPLHRGVQRLVADLNRTYRTEPALHELDCDPHGFSWIDPHDHDQSVITFLRRGKSGAVCLVACNFTPLARGDYRVGVPVAGDWREVLNSDATEYGGTGAGNLGGVTSEAVRAHGHPYSLRITLPPLSALFFVAGARA